ncbi:MAG: SpoIIE family protein phosphatase [Gammaproteobacteria bacterium]|jgi:serine phosphatase RsbU (regulator of sigma subunit)
MKTDIPGILAVVIALYSGGLSAAVAEELTATEMQWLESHRTLRLGSDPSWPPIDFRDENGTPSGVCADYFNYVSDRLNLDTVTGPAINWADTMEKIRRKELDAITCLSETVERKEFIAFSSPIVEIPRVIITTDDHPYIGGLRHLNNARVAMVKGYSTTTALEQDYPAIRPVYFQTPYDALEAVATGQADAYVGVLAVVVHVIEARQLVNLKVAAPAELTPFTLHFGFRKDWPQMAAIFSKVISTMAPEERTAIAQRWVDVEYDPVTDYTLVRKVGGILSGLLLLAVLWIRQVQRQKRVLISQRNTLRQLTQDLEAYGDRVARELEMARQTQTVLLPDMSTFAEIEDVHGIHIDARFEPSSELGGDMWGLKNLDENHAAILMVDFSGHGINAALNTFRLHALLDSEREYGNDPAAFLQHLNRRLSPLLPAGQYATMFYGIIDRASDLLIYAGAATPSPLVILPGASQPLVGSGEGFPLGMFDESTYENRELPFPHGATLLLYSDAVTEGKMKQGRRLGESGLIDVLQHCLKTGVHENLVTALTEKLDELLDQPLTDDLTIVCATRSQARQEGLIDDLFQHYPAQSGSSVRETDSIC